MSIRPKNKRKFEPLPEIPTYTSVPTNIDAEKVLSDKAIRDIIQMEGKLAASLMELSIPDDFDPVHDVKKVNPPVDNRHDSWFDPTVKIGPECFGGSDFDLDPASIDTSRFDRSGFAEAEALMKQFREEPSTFGAKPSVDDVIHKYTKGSNDFHPEEAWIQTYSGKRFTPMKPNADAIVIQDIAHSLSMQCRFSGHVKFYYTVAQHCVLVSHICDHKDALWGLLHDATEAYLIDIPRPLKRSGKFGAYIEVEKVMQDAICERFKLSKEEPESVHRADTILLATEARDLMYPLRYDWTQPVKPLPFKIEPLGPREAKLLYLERFFELIGSPDSFNRYLEYEAHGAI